MMYIRPHIDHKLLSLFLVCSSLTVFISADSLAEKTAKPAPLKVYIPSAIVATNYFSTSTMEYNPDTFILTARGNVEIEQDNVIIKADLLEYDQAANKVIASGDVAILDTKGNVTFVDSLELKNGIKDSLVKRFRGQLADNDIFMAAEEAKGSENSGAHYAGAIPPKDSKNGQSFFGKIMAYFSPKTNDNDAARYAALMPAAGAEPQNNVPLIPLPTDNAPAKIETKGDVLKPLDPVSPSDPIKPPVVNNNELSAPVPPSIPAAAVTAATPVPAQVPAPQDNELLDKVTAVSPEDNAAEKAKEVIQKNTKKAPKDIAKKDIVKKAGKTLIETGEPDESLSPKSRELLEKVSPKLAPKKEKKAPKPLKVNHTRDMQDLFKADELPAAGVQHDALGVKVEQKAQRLNLDYELEKAYDAINSGQSEAAMLTYQNILANAPENTQALFGLATLYHRARQFDKARPLYSKLLSIDPNHRDGFNNFLVLLADEAPREALTELEKLEEKNPGLSTIPAQIAVIYDKVNEPDKAIGKMFRAVSLAPENLTYRYNLAIMLDKQKNYDEAAKLYRQLVEAVARGEKIPGNVDNIQQRLTFISSNRP